MLSDYRPDQGEFSPRLQTRAGRWLMRCLSLALLAIFPLFWTLSALWVTTEAAKRSFLELLATVLYGVREREERGRPKGGDA